jgi:hypothetical protein
VINSECRSYRSSSWRSVDLAQRYDTHVIAHNGDCRAPAHRAYKRSNHRDPMFVPCLQQVPEYLHIFVLTPLSSPISRTYSASSYNTLVRWLQSRISPSPPRMSGSESSLSEGRMPGRLRFYSESVTPPRVQRSTALIHREIAIQYALAHSPSSNFDLIVFLG